MITLNVGQILTWMIFCWLTHHALCASTANSVEEVNVVIIGAGASGYAAGCRLLDRNFTDFVILEAGDRIGGRVHTVPYGNGQIDMGGEWVHGKDGNIIHEWATAFDLIYPSSDVAGTGPIFQSDGKKFDSELFETFYTFLAETSVLDKSNFTGSQGDFFTERYWTTANSLIEKKVLTRAEAEACLVLVEAMWNSNEGSHSWFETSPHSDFTGVTGEFNYNYVWKFGGYSTVFDLLSKKIPNPNNQLKIDDKIRLGKEVTRVDWSGDVVTVICADGSQFTADRVLTTVSLNVLKATANQIFHPTLPQPNTNAITGLGMSTVSKIYLEFPYRWWDPGTGLVAFVWRKEDIEQLPKELDWTAGLFILAAKENFPLNLMCGWMVGKRAEAMEALPDNIVKEEVMKLVRRFVGPSTHVPDAKSILRSKWSINPYVRGAYSYRTVTSDKMNVWQKDLASSVLNEKGTPVLQFAGEATHPRRAGTVNGAVETGFREADRILNEIHN